jgi:hypothetical protein
VIVHRLVITAVSVLAAVCLLAPARVGSAQADCQYAATRRAAQVQDTSIKEASALVASHQWPGIYWTLNDAKNAPLIYAIDQDGRSRGVFRVSGASNVDWEAMQLGPDGMDGFALFVGDVGNNELKRREMVIYRVPEPEPGPPGDRSVRETAPATPLRFAYPVNPNNTEAMLVHPQTGEVALITKQDSGISLIYRLPLPLEGGVTMLAELVDVLDVRTRDVANKQVTDGTVSSDGTRVALRTYAGVLLYDVPASKSLAEVDWQSPSTFRLSDGVKGEGITFRLNSNDLVTVGEEVPAALYETNWVC